MAKNYRMKAEPGSYQVTGNDVALTHTVIATAVRKNWWLVTVYVLVTIVGMSASYFTNEWWSVALSFVVATITFLVGYFMLQKVITITNERR